MRFMHHARWDSALFVHYEVDAAALQLLLPPGLEVDLFDGRAYVGLVALSEQGITPAIPFLPRFLQRLLALSHHAVNARTYVRPSRGHGPPGIFFFTLECSGFLPAFGASLLFNLPYRAPLAL
jgi:hypothetical protein